MSAFQLFGYALSPIVSAAFAEAASGDPLAEMVEVSRANATLVARADGGDDPIARRRVAGDDVVGLLWRSSSGRGAAKRAVAYGSESTPADAGDAGATPAGDRYNVGGSGHSVLERKVSGGI